MTPMYRLICIRSTIDALAVAADNEVDQTDLHNALRLLALELDSALDTIDAPENEVPSMAAREAAAK